jgi:hypothetical protein
MGRSAAISDATLDLLNAIWHRPSSPTAESSEEGGVSLRTFVNEILRRSRSSCATLRAARWYLEVRPRRYSSVWRAPFPPG